mmetsp:Transcript_7641/g.26314  ORF Transcript_7641/g.26314 Transcript_7641/m.26314 type:complete len:330 (-) Transcript_7641:20-1009(-)
MLMKQVSIRVMKRASASPGRTSRHHLCSASTTARTLRSHSGSHPSKETTFGVASSPADAFFPTPRPCIGEKVSQLDWSLDIFAETKSVPIVSFLLLRTRMLDRCWTDFASWSSNAFCSGAWTICCSLSSNSCSFVSTPANSGTPLTDSNPSLICFSCRPMVVRSPCLKVCSTVASSCAIPAASPRASLALLMFDCTRSITWMFPKVYPTVLWVFPMPSTICKICFLNAPAFSCRVPSSCLASGSRSWAALATSSTLASKSSAFSWSFTSSSPRKSRMSASTATSLPPFAPAPAPPSLALALRASRSAISAFSHAQASKCSPAAMIPLSI